MALISGQLRDNPDFKFLELRKARICNQDEALDLSSINLIATSNPNKLMFIAIKNVLKIIELDAILNFEWSKNVINQVIESIPSIEINVKLYTQYLSTNPVENNILLVCGADQNQQLFISAYTMDDIIQRRESVEPFSCINLSSGTPGRKFQSIEWHPELSNSLVAMCLSDGSLITIGIDIQSKTTILLSSYKEDLAITSLSWSPKGKQIVAGMSNGCLRQFKHQNGKSITFAKMIQPPNDINTYQISSVKWILSSLFFVAYMNPNSSDPDTRYVLVSSPPKSQVQYYDYGTYFMGISINDPTSFNVNFQYLGNLLLCLCNSSSEVGVIGCSSKELNSPSNWEYWMLDDSARIELPFSSSKAETYPRGVGVFFNSPKIFTISETERYGGPNCPVIVILSSDGILCPYYVIYKDISIPENLISKSVPAPFSRPLESKQVETPTKPVNISQTQLFSRDKINIPIIEKQPKAIQSPNPVSDLNQDNKSTPQIVTRNEKVAKLPDDWAQKVEADLEKDKEIASNKAFAETIISFSKELVSLKKNCSQIRCLKVGTNEERVKLQIMTNEIADLIEATKEAIRSISDDVEGLKNYLLESFAMTEEARSRMDRDQDPRYLYLLRRRALDPQTARKAKEVQNFSQYVELQLRELNHILDQEWEDFVAEQKGKKSTFKDFDLIYKTLSNNQKTVNYLKKQLHNLYEQCNLSPPSNEPNQNTNEDIAKLTESMKKSHLEEMPNSSFLTKEKTKYLFEVETISKTESRRIKEFYDQRPQVPIRKSSVAIFPTISMKSANSILKSIKAAESPLNRSIKSLIDSKNDIKQITYDENQPKSKIDSLPDFSFQLKKDSPQKIVFSNTTFKPKTPEKSTQPVAFTVEKQPQISSIFNTPEHTNTKQLSTSLSPTINSEKTVFSIQDKPKEIFQPQPQPKTCMDISSLTSLIVDIEKNKQPSFQEKIIPEANKLESEIENNSPKEICQPELKEKDQSLFVKTAEEKKPPQEMRSETTLPVSQATSFGISQPTPFNSPTPSFGGTQNFSGGFAFGGIAEGNFGQKTASTASFATSTTFSASPSFGASPPFGGSPSFGGQPAFGGSPAFGSITAFGGSPSFGGLGFGATNNPQSPPPFAGFAAVPDLPTFGALASQAPQFEIQQQQQQSTSGGFRSDNEFSTASSTVGFGAPPQFASSSFTQRRA